MKKDFFKDILTGNDGKPVEANMFLQYDGNTRAVGEILKSIKQFPRFICVMEDADNKKPKLVLSSTITPNDASILCIQGALEAQRGQ